MIISKELDFVLAPTTSSSDIFLTKYIWCNANVLYDAARELYFSSNYYKDPRNVVLLAVDRFLDDSNCYYFQQNRVPFTPTSKTNLKNINRTNYAKLVERFPGTKNEYYDTKKIRNRIFSTFKLDEVEYETVSQKSSKQLICRASIKDACLDITIQSNGTFEILVVDDTNPPICITNLSDAKKYLPICGQLTDELDAKLITPSLHYSSSRSSSNLDEAMKNCSSINSGIWYKLNYSNRTQVYMFKLSEFIIATCQLKLEYGDTRKPYLVLNTDTNEIKFEWR